VWALPGFLIVWAYHIPIGFLLAKLGQGTYMKRYYILGLTYIVSLGVSFLHNMFMKDGLAKDVIAARVIWSCGGEERFLRAMM
jgi:hypothetical protein